MFFNQSTFHYFIHSLKKKWTVSIHYEVWKTSKIKVWLKSRKMLSLSMISAWQMIKMSIYRLKYLCNMNQHRGMWYNKEGRSLLTEQYTCHWNSHTWCILLADTITLVVYRLPNNHSLISIELVFYRLQSTLNARDLHA